MIDASHRRKSPAERWSLPARQARSVATRERLLDAAEVIFAKKGYDGARLSDIAEEAGCSVGAVYFRFKDKNALFSAIAESFIDDARRGLTALFGTPQIAPERALRNFVTASAANFRKHRGLFRAIVERGIDHPDAMKTIFRFRDEIARALARTLRYDADSLAVRVTTQMVYGFLIAGALNRHAPASIDDAKAVECLADACAAYLVRGAHG